jgi:hypothetical protein
MVVDFIDRKAGMESYLTLGHFLVRGKEVALKVFPLSLFSLFGLLTSW